LYAFDRLVLAVFVVELLSRFFVHRGRFFGDPWRVFDFVVVGIAVAAVSSPVAAVWNQRHFMQCRKAPAVAVDSRTPRGRRHQHGAS